MSRRIIDWGKRALDLLPVMLPVLLASFGAVCIVLLLAGQLKSAYVLIFGLPVAVAAMWLLWHHYPKTANSRELLVCNILVVVGVAIWVGFNVLYTSEHVFTNRDPSTYANAAAWLVNHDSIKIEIPEVLQDVPGVHENSAGFGTDRSGDTPFIYAQGLHLLPVLLGLGGRIVGSADMLHLNVLLGATALLAVYSFARLLARPRWSLLPTAALAASMPMIYFSRDTYTEPLAATFTFGALALLWVAIKSKRIPIWFLAGLVAGAGTLTRIDGYLVVGALMAFLAAWLAFASKDERRIRVKQTLAMGVGMALTSILGWLDLSQLANPYYLYQSDNFSKEMLFLVVIVVMGSVAVVLAWRTSLLARLNTLTRKWRSAAAAALVLIIAAFMASRPLWLEEYGKFGARNFFEESLQWLDWYIGPLLAAAGVIGLAIVASRAVKNRNLLYLGGLLVVGISALFYIMKPHIGPDQIWASRRFLPVAMPGIAVFAVVAFDWLDKNLLTKIQWGGLFGLILAVFIVMAPLTTSHPILGQKDTTQLGAITSVCDRLPENSVVLWQGMARLEAVMPTRAFCGVPAYGFHPKKAEKVESLVHAYDLAKRAGKIAVVGVYGSQQAVYFQEQKDSLSLVSPLEYQMLEKIRGATPRYMVPVNDSLRMGLLQPDGSVRPLD